ncbi:unnamed protein product, partial [Dovyalis caffra]
VCSIVTAQGSFGGACRLVKKLDQIKKKSHQACGYARRSLQTGKLTVVLPEQDKRAIKSSQYDCRRDLYNNGGVVE